MNQRLLLTICVGLLAAYPLSYVGLRASSQLVHQTYFVDQRGRYHHSQHILASTAPILTKIYRPLWNLECWVRFDR